LRRTLLIAAFCVLAVPALADDDAPPQGPKAPPPEPLPEPICDVAKPDGGDWLLGRWVAPYAKWAFERNTSGKLAWVLEQKPDINRAAGWKDGARIEGRVAAVSGCTVKLEAGEGGVVAFAFEGVKTDDGKIYGFAVNPAGQQIRWVLRRER
jgi:hypothetical protein